MAEGVLVRLFEHNNWANVRLIEACSGLTDEQLDATPRSPSEWSVRRTLTHVVHAQRGYLSILTRATDRDRPAEPPFAELARVAAESGEGLLALARDEAGLRGMPRIRSSDGFLLEPWVVLVQVINHATEHRRQICGMLRALGMTPPGLDGWTFGESMDAVVPVSP